MSLSKSVVTPSYSRGPSPRYILTSYIGQAHSLSGNQCPWLSISTAFSHGFHIAATSYAMVIIVSSYSRDPVMTKLMTVGTTMFRICCWQLERWPWLHPAALRTSNTVSTHLAAESNPSGHSLDSRRFTVGAYAGHFQRMMSHSRVHHL